MTDFEPQEDLPPVAHVTIVYTGPVAPHWELQVRYGDQKLLDDFWARVNARLLLLPKHDPQFRRNRERVNRDAERERITCDWDLGEHDADTTITPVAETPVEPTAPEAPSEAAIEDPAVAEVPSEAAIEDPTAPEAPSEAAIEDPAVAEVPSEAAIEDPAVAEVPSEAAEADPSGDVDAVVETDAAETQTADA